MNIILDHIKNLARIGFESMQLRLIPLPRPYRKQNITAPRPSNVEDFQRAVKIIKY